MKLKESEKLSWPNQLAKRDTLRAVKRKRGWVIRVETTAETDWQKKNPISGQDLLGYYKTKAIALRIIDAMEAARKAPPRDADLCE